MPFEDGVFTRVANSFSNPVAGTLISPADADAYFDDLDEGLTQAGSGVFNVSAGFASPQAALDAAVAAHGGVVVFPPGDFSLAAPLTIPSGTIYPIRITGSGTLYAGPASSHTQIFYAGAVAAIIARDCASVEIDHLQIFCTNASVARVIDFSATTPGSTYSFAPYVHDCTVETTTATVSCIGIDLHDTQCAVIERNCIAINSGTGIQGIPAGGLWSVKATIAKNLFSVANAVGIKGPGQTWTIENNTAQAVAAFITPAPAGRTDVLTVRGNWIGDFFVSGVTMIHSNAGVLVSEGNTYANFATGGICILQDDSTGAVISKGDRLEGAVGVAIGTGNYLSIDAPDQGHLPTTLYTGTPANVNVIKTVGGAMDVTGKLSLGKSGSYAGSLRLWTTTSGAHSTTIAPTDGATGLITLTTPGESGTLVTRSDNVTLTNKIMSGASNTFTNLNATNSAITDDTATSASMLPVWVTTSTGNLPLKVSSSKMSFNPSIPSFALNTGTAPTTSLISASGGGTTLTGTNQFALNFQPTFSSAATSIGAGIYVAPSTVAASFTCGTFVGIYIDNGTKGAGSTITTQTQLRILTPTYGTTNYSIHSAGGRNFFGGGLALGSDSAVAAGEVQASASIKSIGPTSGVGYATGAGGAVTQGTSRTTGVTLDKVCGAITLFAAAPAVGTWVSFTVTNSAVAATDSPHVAVKSGTNTYIAHVTAVAAGSFQISFTSIVGTASDSPVITFDLCKAVAA